MRTKWIGWKELKISDKLQFIWCCSLILCLIILCSIFMFYFLMSPGVGSNPINLNDVLAKDKEILEKYLHDTSASNQAEILASWDRITSYSNLLVPNGILDPVSYNNILSNQNNPATKNLKSQVIKNKIDFKLDDDEKAQQMWDTANAIIERSL